MGELPKTPSAGPPAIWTVPEPGMHRAVSGGRIVGHVVHEGGGFIAFDAMCTPVGRYESLHAARLCALAGARVPVASLARRWSGRVVAMMGRLVRPGRRMTWRSVDGQARSEGPSGFAA